MGGIGSKSISLSGAKDVSYSSFYLEAIDPS
jgi:hypothetical protein